MCRLFSSLLAHPFLPQATHLPVHDLRPAELLLPPKAAELGHQLFAELLDHPGIAVLVHERPSSATQGVDGIYVEE